MQDDGRATSSAEHARTRGEGEGRAAIPISLLRQASVEELFVLDKFLQMLGNRFCH
jgi:hypothetical protein